MLIKKYEGCAVDNHNGIYTGRVLALNYAAELLQSGILQSDIDILLAGPDNSDEYCDVWADVIPFTIPGYTFEGNESGDILVYSLIDSDTITIEQLNELAKSANPRGISVYKNQFGYANIAQLGENCLCRVSLANTGIISADLFYELDDSLDFNAQLADFIVSEIKPKLREEFEESHIILTLPAYYASYLINGDPSGLSDDEQIAIDKFILTQTGIGLCVGCSDDFWFAHSNDLGNLGADVKEFYFRKVGVE